MSHEAMGRWYFARLGREPGEVVEAVSGANLLEVLTAASRIFAQHAETPAPPDGGRLVVDILRLDAVPDLRLTRVAHLRQIEDA